MLWAKQGDIWPRMQRQNIVKIRRLQLVFIFAFYLSYFICFCTIFFLLKSYKVFVLRWGLMELRESSHYMS